MVYMEIKGFIPREYQLNIVETAKNKNTLCVLPTGTGKTKIFILLTIHRLNNFPDSKVLICTPTKPLSSQICNELKECTTINPKDIILLTGAINPEKRIDMWKNAKVIVATPQTIESDLENKRISLEDFSLLTLDEAHRSRIKYANTIVTKKYVEQSKFPRILALTASPGGTKEKIKEICDNLMIESVEIRSVFDEDIKNYIQEKETEWVGVDLPIEFKQIIDLIKIVYRESLEGIKKFGLNKPLKVINKKDLLLLQKRLQQTISRGNPAGYHGISIVAKLIKLIHALELIETQGPNQLKEYWQKLLKEETKAAKSILDKKEISKAIELTGKIGIQHPKMDKLCSIISEQIKNDPNSKVIVFANFRSTVKEIVSTLAKLENIRPIDLMGQKEGITQKKQIETIKKFSEGQYNILVGTSITEEGLDIKGGADVAIFYEPIPSEIRSIQRMGRVGRISKGKIIILITKNTRDEAYYWSSKNKEKVMRKTLYKMKQEQKNLNGLLE